MKNIIYFVFITFLTGCTSLSVEKADGSKGEGISFYLPKTIMTLVPHPTLGYTVKWETIADNSQEYRISQTGTWAVSNYTIDTNKGMLKSISATNNSAAIPEALVQGYQSVKEAEAEAELIIAKAVREKADTELKNAIDERDQLKDSIKTLESTLSDLEKAKSQAELTEGSKERSLTAAKKDLEFHQGRLDNLKNQETPDYTAISAAHSSVQVAIAKVNTATDDYKSAGLHLKQTEEEINLTKEKIKQKESELKAAEKKVNRLKASLPDKRLPNSVSDSSTSGAASNSSTMSAPIVFTLELNDKQQPHLSLMSYELINPSQVNQISLKIVAPRKDEPTKKICDPDTANIPKDLPLEDEGAWYRIEFDIPCALPESFNVSLIKREGTDIITVEEYKFAQNDEPAAQRFVVAKKNDSELTVTIGIQKETESIKLKEHCKEEKACEIKAQTIDDADDLWLISLKIE